jgi:hypothetical protein
MSRRRVSVGLVCLVLAISVIPLLLHHTRMKEFVMAKTSHLMHAFSSTTVETFYYTGQQFVAGHCLAQIRDAFIGFQRHLYDA